jgi:hypothetical protein
MLPSIITIAVVCQWDSFNPLIPILHDVNESAHRSGLISQVETKCFSWFVCVINSGGFIIPIADVYWAIVARPNYYDVTRPVVPFEWVVNDDWHPTIV